MHLALGADLGAQSGSNDLAVDCHRDLSADAFVFDDPGFKARVKCFECIDDLAHGRPLDAERIGAMADSAASQADPIEDARGSAWYKREIIRVHVRRALERLSNGSGD